MIGIQFNFNPIWGLAPVVGGLNLHLAVGTDARDQLWLESCEKVGNDWGFCGGVLQILQFLLRVRLFYDLRNLRSEAKGLLDEPRTRLKFRDCAFSISALQFIYLSYELRR